MPTSRLLIPCAVIFGCVDAKPSSEDTGPEPSEVADGMNFDEAWTDYDADDGSPATSTDADDDESDVDADDPVDDTAVEDDTATSDGTGGTADGESGGEAGGTEGAGSTSGVGGTGSASGADGTDGSAAEGEASFRPNRIYVWWTASFQDGTFADTLFIDPETGIERPTDNFISFLLTEEETYDEADERTHCQLQFRIDEAVPTDFDSWAGWDNMAFELDTTIDAIPPSSGCAGMAAALGVEDPVADYLAAFPWIFGYGPMKESWADELETLVGADFTDLGDAAGTVHLQFSALTEAGGGMNEWGYFRVHPYDSGMLVDRTEVIPGVSTASKPPDGLYVMNFVYAISIAW